ncbi:mechanosensitive ion channel [bacterium]|nr:mechanosensitive ion channel [bacterium]
MQYSVLIPILDEIFTVGTCRSLFSERSPVSLRSFLVARSSKVLPHGKYIGSNSKFSPHKTVELDLGIIVVAILAIALGLATVFGLTLFPRVIGFITSKILPNKLKILYDGIFRPFNTWIGVSLLLLFSDIVLLFFQQRSLWLDIIEFIVGLILAFNAAILGFKISKQFFDDYLLKQAVRGEGEANSELLILYKYLSNAVILLTIIFIFAQTHQVNVVGLLASLGVGGIAIALAAQKVLEQVLWSTMIFLDRPFVIDDYIHLSDGTFGRVESIGWRSSRIRLSGKGTLVVIPNSMLTQMAIENLTGAQKVISLINVTFYRSIPAEERALVRQLILSSTNGIYGIDHRLTEVAFQDVSGDRNGNPGTVRAQIRFFILGTGENSMEIRGQFLEAARQIVMRQLKDYGIDFKIEEGTVNITSPMNI